MDSLIVLVILVAIIGGAMYYIYKAKKSGQKCIGCPHAKQCTEKSKCDTLSEK